MEIAKVCRLCGDAPKGPMLSIFSKNENGHQLIQLIKQCLPILVYRTDPLSKEICQKCYGKLNEYSSFQKNTIYMHDHFKSTLLHRLHESPVKLYVDTLEEAYHPDNIQLTNYRSLRPLRTCASQIKIETKTTYTNTDSDDQSFRNSLSLTNLTILTPSKINEKSSPNTSFVSKIIEDGIVVKKRRLNGPRAGPRCKTKPHLKPYNLLTFQPLTLMQCVLKQINRNLHLFDDACNSLDSFATEGTTDTGSIYQDYDEYTPSPDMSTMESSEYSATELPTDMVELELKPKIEPEPEFDFHIDVDINAPAMCNYCMKRFTNLSDLAFHEIKHIKVDIGPRVGTKEFNMLFTKLAFYFNDYLRRQNLLPPKEVKQISKPVTRNISKGGPKPSTSKPVFRAVASKSVKAPLKLETKSHDFLLKQPKLEVIPELEELPKLMARPKDKINYEDIDQPYDDDNSLLIPHVAPNTAPSLSLANQNIEYEYKIENDEIFVNGILLRNMEKNDRKACYKDIMVEGLKRKFCPLCRYTFKDNWSIENHYMSGICLYTCKFCGRKFKYHKELFESHLITHKNETPTKIFGPKDRQYKKKLKNKRLLRPMKPPLIGHMINTIPPKVKPIKIKQLMQRKMNDIKIPQNQPKIKIEPGLLPLPLPGITEASTSNSNEPYQAYFCRRCFKVFFNVTEYNSHIRVCCGTANSINLPKTKHTPLRPRDKPSETRVSTPDSSSSGNKRPLRTCVKESPGLSSDNDSQGSDNMLKRNLNKQITNNIDKIPESVWECGICCSNFPSKYSRNSHMRIHKGQIANNMMKVTPPPKTKLSMTSKQELQQTVAANFMQQQFHHQPLHFPPQHSQHVQSLPPSQNLQYSNLNPAVARLVQNNPHLTIRSYSKSQPDKHDLTPPQFQRNQQLLNDHDAAEHSIKRNYKCADCDEKFENKSVLYYHKMNSCIVKRHYECAFCRKKFGTYDQYNTHMFYVHPE